MIEAQGYWTILEYEREKDMTDIGGILVPTARNQRKMIKGTTHTISSDPDQQNLPDVVRIGTVVSGKLKKDTTVLFNKHDGFGFDLDGKYLYAIKDELIMAVLK